MKFGALEIGLIILLVVIVFGAGKLPDVGNALGRSIREFRKGKAGDLDEAKESTKESEKPVEKK